MSTDLTTADPIPTPVEINTPRVRRQMSDLVHGQLTGSIPPEQIRDLLGAIFVLMNRASARPGPDPISVAEKASNQLTAEDRIGQIQGRCTHLLATSKVRHMEILEILQIVGKPGQVTR